MDAPFPEAGDVVDHFAFGRCNVLKSDGDEVLIQDSATGRSRTVRLGVLHLKGPSDLDGKRLFRLTQRRPRG